MLRLQCGVCHDSEEMLSALSQYVVADSGIKMFSTYVLNNMCTNIIFTMAAFLHTVRKHGNYIIT